MQVLFKNKDLRQFSVVTLFVIPIFTQASSQSPLDSNHEGLNISPDHFELQIEGRMMWDVDIFNGVHREEKFEADLELRDAQVTFESKLNKTWKAEFQLNFDEKDETVKIADANIKYTGWNALKLTLGRAKEPFGLEKLTSSSHLTLIEPAMVTEAFAPSRNNGVNVSGDRDNVLWSFGLYEIDPKDDSDRNHYAMTGRWVYTPWHQHNHVLHLGMAGSIRNLDGEKYKLEERAEVHTADKIVTSAKTFTDQIKLLGLETAWLQGPFSLQAEYMTADIETETETNIRYAGYYLQGSYFLTGESRTYEKGQFGKIKPRAQSGAWELTIRYSILDTKDRPSGVKAANVTLGMNYYVNQQIRFMINYIHTQLNQEHSREDGHALSLRAQYDF